MAINIDTLIDNKSTFRPDRNDPESDIWDLTTASVSYIDVDISIKRTVVVTEYFQMRPDLIAAIDLGDQNKMGSLLKLNGISNPFALSTGRLLMIPEASTIKDSIKASGSSGKISTNSSNNTEAKNTVNEFRKSQESKKFQISDGRKQFLKAQNDLIKNKPINILPPNVLQPNDRLIAKKDGFIIFAPDAGNGNNKPTNK